jgi:hypothetical protein
MMSAIKPKGHQKGVKVPNNGPQGSQSLDTKDEIEPTQIDSKAVNGEA